MRLTLNISPCPNDTFMFDALINNRIDTHGIDFDVNFLDIEQLNNHLLSNQSNIHISKTSYSTVPRVLPHYRLLRSGSALGRGNGPVLIAKSPMNSAEFAGARVAIPGEFTTANMLLSHFFPQITDKPAYLFSRIANAVQAGEVKAGVLIHEGRFTYHERGLHLIADLGELWEKSTGLPLPLGGIVASRSLPCHTHDLIEKLIEQSVKHAFEHPEDSAEFVRSHAQEMSQAAIDKHIKMFVNEFSLSLGSEGCAALSKLLNIHENALFK